MRLLLAALGVIAACLPAAALDDPFAGAPRARLHVRIELAGAARVDFPNQVEWAAIDAWRTMELDFALVDVGNDGVPIVASATTAPAVPPAMAGLEGQLAACGEDQGCLGKVMRDFAKANEGNANIFAQLTGQQPGRYRNFAADRSRRWQIKPMFTAAQYHMVVTELQHKIGAKRERSTFL